MRILHVVPSYLPATRYGGPIYSVHGLCRALPALGHEIHVFTTSVDGDGDSDVPLGQAVDIEGVKVWYFAAGPLRRLYYSSSMQRALRDRVRGFDLVHLHSVFLWPTWVAARAARSAGVPYVLSPRGMLVKELIQRRSRWLKTAWIKLMETSNIEGAAAIHVTSAREAEDLRVFRLRLPSVWAIPNGIDVPEAWTQNALSSDVKAVWQQGGYVLFLGRINWKKGLDRLLAAWREMPNTRLVIAGNDEENYLPVLKRAAEEAGVSGLLTFLPRSITGVDKEALFAGASLFVLPSYSENFGNTVLEAMVRSVPVVVTEEVGAGEVVRQSGGGLMVPASQLAQAISGLLRDPQSLMKMGEKGHSWVSGRYDWLKIAEEMASRYMEIVHA